MPNLHLIMVTQVIIIQLKYLDLSVTYMHMHIHIHIHRYTCSLSSSMIQDICRCNLQVVVLSPLAT